MKEEVLVEAFVVDDALHTLKVAVVELRCQVLGIASHAASPRLLALGLIAGKIQSYCLIVEQVRFITLLIEKSYPQQVLCVAECASIEVQHVGDELYQRHSLLRPSSQQLPRFFSQKQRRIFA